MPELYDQIGRAYAARRHADPRIAADIHRALAGCESVLNVGAGAGSYEPATGAVVALEPSRVMIAQRAAGSAPVVRGRAERLPFGDAGFDAVMGVLTLHHWTDQRRGLEECARVARDRVVLLTWDPSITTFWLVSEYFPEFIARDRERFPSLDAIAGALGELAVEPVLVPADCTDGFLGAFWRRPSAYLQPELRRGISSFAQLPSTDAGFAKLEHDLESGEWHRRHEDLLALDAIDLGYRVIVAHPHSH